MRSRRSSFLVSCVIATLLTMGIVGILVIAGGCSVLPTSSAPSDKPSETTSSVVSMKTLTTLGVVATGGGVAASLMGNPAVGIPLAGAGATITVLGITISRYGALIAAVGGIALLACFVVVLAWKLKKYKAGFVDVVKTVQAAKAEVFAFAGPGAKDIFSSTLKEQSDATQALVKKTKVRESIR